MRAEGVVIETTEKWVDLLYCPCQGPLGSVRSEAWKMKTQHVKTQEGAFQTQGGTFQTPGGACRHREEQCEGPEGGRNLTFPRNCQPRPWPCGQHAVSKKDSGCTVHGNVLK